ncbi:hypothetical protein PQX77_002835, partial [Marasmius sp. AFHP31]
MRIVASGSCVKDQQVCHSSGAAATKLKAGSLNLDEEIRELKKRVEELEAEAGEMKEELAAQEDNKRDRKREVAALRGLERQVEPVLSIPSPPPSAARHRSRPTATTPAPALVSPSSLLKRKRADPEPTTEVEPEAPTSNPNSPSRHSGTSAFVLSIPTVIHRDGPCQRLDVEGASLCSCSEGPPPVLVLGQEDLPSSTTSLPPRFRLTKRKRVDSIAVETSNPVSSLSQGVGGENRKEPDENNEEEAIPKTKKRISESRENEQMPKTKPKSVGREGVAVSSPRPSASTTSYNRSRQEPISAPVPSSSSRLSSAASRPTPVRQALSTAECGQAAELSPLTDSEDDESDIPVVKKKRNSNTSARSRSSKRIENRRKATGLRDLTDSDEDNLEVPIFQKEPRSSLTATKLPASAGHTPTALRGGDDARAKLRKKRMTVNTGNSKDGGIGRGTTKPNSPSVDSKRLASSSTGAARSNTTVPVPAYSRHEVAAVSATAEKPKLRHPRPQPIRATSSRSAASGSAGQPIPAPSTASHPQPETNRAVSSFSGKGSGTKKPEPSVAKSPIPPPLLSNTKTKQAIPSSSSSTMLSSANSHDDDVIDLTLLNSDKEEPPKEDVLVITDDSDNDGDLEILCVTLRPKGAGDKGGATPMDNGSGTLKSRSRTDGVGMDADTGVGREKDGMGFGEDEKSHPRDEMDIDVDLTNVATTTNTTARSPPTPNVKRDPPSSCDLEYTPPTQLHPDLIELFYQPGKTKKP